MKRTGVSVAYQQSTLYPFKLKRNLSFHHFKMHQSSQVYSKKMSANLAGFEPFSFLPLTIIPIKKIRTSGVERKNGRFYRTFLFRFCQQLYCCQKISGKYELRNLPSKSLAFLSNDRHISHFTQLMKVEILVFRE